MSAAHNWINFDKTTQVLNSGVTAKGNNRNNTCNGAYKGSLNVGAETRGDDDIEKNLSSLMLHSTHHRIALTTEKLLLSSNFGVSCHNTECQSVTGSS